MPRKLLPPSTALDMIIWFWMLNGLNLLNPSSLFEKYTINWYVPFGHFARLYLSKWLGKSLFLNLLKYLNQSENIVNKYHRFYCWSIKFPCINNMTRNNKEDFSNLRAAPPDLSFANRLFSFWSKVVTMCFEFLSCLLSHVTQLTSKGQMIKNLITFLFKTMVKFLAASFHQNCSLSFGKQQ